MPKGPKGLKRPAEVVGNAVHVIQIATGEDEEEYVNDGKTRPLSSLTASADRRGQLYYGKEALINN